MKKLLAFTENYERGGGNRYMIDLINSSALDYKQIIICSNKGGIFDSDIKRLKSNANLKTVYFITGLGLLRNNIFLFGLMRKIISFVLLLLDPLFHVFNVCYFLLLLLRHKPTKVLSCNGGYPAAKATLSLVIAAKLLKIPAILSVVSLPTKRNFFFSFYEKILDSIIWRSADCVLVNAQAIKNALILQRAAVSEKIHVIYNGIEDNQINNFQNNKSQNNKSQRIIIGCVARIERAKGSEDLFEAFTNLSLIYPNIYLVLIGDGESMSSLSARSHNLGLENRVSFVGYYDGPIKNYINKFDIYVFPSWWEGFPYSILEALCAGSAIIATNVGGIPEAINDGINGILIEPKSPSEIFTAVKLLIDNTRLRNRLSKSARRKFLENFTLDKMHLKARQFIC